MFFCQDPTVCALRIKYSNLFLPISLISLWPDPICWMWCLTNLSLTFFLNDITNFFFISDLMNYFLAGVDQQQLALKPISLTAWLTLNPEL